MSRLERELIVRALKQTSGNVTHAARLLKISRKGLQLKMKELGLRERDERGDTVRWSASALRTRRLGCSSSRWRLAGCSRGKQRRARGAMRRRAARQTRPVRVAARQPPVDGGEPAPPRRGMMWIPPGTLIAGTPARPNAARRRRGDARRAGRAARLLHRRVRLSQRGRRDPQDRHVARRGRRDSARRKASAPCTELEWERACKGPSNTIYEYGDSYRAAECTMGLPAKTRAERAARCM